ncbi:MAG: enoyl-CoA hydratase-related protein [Chloroflexota bacterium]
MPFEHLLLERHGHVTVVTLNRPEKLNALNQRLREEIVQCFGELEQDDSVRAVVVTGAGRGFCAGADLTAGERRPSEGATETEPQTRRLDEYEWIGHRAHATYRMTKPTIAAVNGVAFGGGMSLALGCDLRVGCENSRLKTGFLERSLSPDSGMSYLLPHIVGYARAMDLILTNRDLRGEECMKMGLLDRYTDADHLLEEAIALGAQISALPPMAVRSAKRVVQRNLHLDLEPALREELRGIFYARRAPNDAKESTAAFLEKRKANFTGT